MRPKDIGTRYETKIVNELNELPGSSWVVHRSEAGKKSWDIRGLPFPVECKVRKTWSIPAWVRKIREVSPIPQWAIFVSDRDLRRADSPGEVVVISKELFYEMLMDYLQEEPIHDQDTD